MIITSCQVVAILFGLYTVTLRHWHTEHFSPWCHPVVPFLRESTDFLHLWSSFVSGKCQCSPHHLCRVTVQCSACCKTLFSSPKPKNLPLLPTTFGLLKNSPPVDNVPKAFFLFLSLSNEKTAEDLKSVRNKLFWCSFQRLFLQFFKGLKFPYFPFPSQFASQCTLLLELKYLLSLSSRYFLSPTYSRSLCQFTGDRLCKNHGSIFFFL